MTRINVVPVEELSDKHLRGEYHEITMVPGNLLKSLNRKSKPFNSSEIPPEYVLGKGHVKFFYDKMLFLQKRYIKLGEEMRSRGFNAKNDLSHLFNMPNYYNDYKPTQEAIEINKKRIKDRS